MKQRSPVNCCIFSAVLFCLLSALLSGCSSTPMWPMENIGTAQFSGNLTSPGNILILPSSDTRNTCQSSPPACQAFVSSLANSINAASTAQAFLTQNYETFYVVHGQEDMVQKEVARVRATYLLIWDVGLIDDRKPFSFGPDAFSIGTLKVIAADTGETAMQLTKPYGLLNPNTEDFSQLAGETGRRIGSYIAPHFN